MFCFVTVITTTRVLVVEYEVLHQMIAGRFVKVLSGYHTHTVRFVQ